jgi:hypothetical protein
MVDSGDDITSGCNAAQESVPAEPAPMAPEPNQLVQEELAIPEENPAESTGMDMDVDRPAGENM